MSILKQILYVILRNWAASLLTIFAARHWVTPDQQHQVTLWFNGWLDVALTTLLAALLPIAFGIYQAFKSWLKVKVALILPKGVSEQSLRNMMSNAGAAAVLTQDVYRVANQSMNKNP